MLGMDGGTVPEFPMRKLAWFALLLPLIALAAPPSEHVCPHAGGPAMGGPPGEDGYGQGPLHRQVVERAAELGIPEAEVTAITAIAEAHRDEVMALRDEVHAASQAMQTAMDADPPDRTAVFAASDRLGEAQQNLREQKLEVALQIRAHLTDAQWDALRPAPGEGPRCGMGGMGGGPGGGECGKHGPGGGHGHRQ